MTSPHDPIPETTRRSIDRRRAALYETMQHLEASLARPSGLEDWHGQVAEALTELRELLEHHVEEVEAPGGLFNEVIDRAPHLLSAVDEMRAEHRHLVDQCDRVLSHLTEGADISSLRAEALELVRDLSEHRQSGAELLFDAYNVDIGALD